MIICSCNRLSDREIKAATRTHRPLTAKAAYRVLGCGFDCGQCLRAAHHLVRAEQGRAMDAIAAE